MASGRRAVGKIRSSVTPGGRKRNLPKKRVDPVSYDGDDDGKITNPLTGADEIPWNRESETPDEAIARFFGGSQPRRSVQDIASSRPTSSQPAQGTESTINSATAPKWPTQDDGTFKPVGKLSDTELSKLLADWEKLGGDSSRDDVKKLLANLRRESTMRANKTKPASDEQLAEIESVLPNYIPREGAWGGPSRESFFFEGSRAEERMRTPYINADIVDARDVGYDEDGYIVVGEYYDGFGGESLIEDDVHASIEDAMKYLEDYNDLLEDGNDPYDPEWVGPEINQITNGVAERLDIDEPNTSETIAYVQEMMREKWFDRRRIDNIDNNIDLARDRLSELSLAEQSVTEEYYATYPEFGSAFYMNENDYARMLLRNGQVETLAEGREIHRAAMDAWDQMAEDLDALGQMRSRVQSDLDGFIQTAQGRAERGDPNFQDFA